LAGSGAEFPDPLLRQIATSNWDDFHNKVRAGTLRKVWSALSDGLLSDQPVYKICTNDTFLVRFMRCASSDNL
jgi:hypothetical protein